MTNDLSGDQRVDRVCRTLTEMGFQVLLVGRRLPESQPLAERPYAIHRMRLIFRKGPLFYGEYNKRLLLFLLFRRFDLLLANDLDTLTANRVAGWLRRKPVVYDSHEYFTEVPELVGRPRIQSFWRWLEKHLVPGVAAACTVSSPIAEVYSRLYGIPFAVVRNLPFLRKPEKEESVIPEVHPDLPLIIYQGALNKGRGVEKAILAMDLLPEAQLAIAGSGDLEEELQLLVAGLHLKNVRFTGKLPPEKLWNLTRQASLGISLEEDLGLSYRYALPNKLFDYIQARIPVVVSDLPEMGRIVKDYDIGLIASSFVPEVLATTFREALFNDVLRQKWAFNLEEAAVELNWDKEKEILMRIFAPFVNP